MTEITKITVPETTAIAAWTAAEAVKADAGQSSTLGDDATVFNYLDDLSTDDKNFHSLTVWLYAADTEWEAWVASITAEEDATRTENEKTYQDEYSGYVLAMRCDITKVDENDSATGRA